MLGWAEFLRDPGREEPWWAARQALCLEHSYSSQREAETEADLAQGHWTVTSRGGQGAGLTWQVKKRETRKIRAQREGAGGVSWLSAVSHYLNGAPFLHPLPRVKAGVETTVRGWQAMEGRGGLCKDFLR